MIGIDPLKTIRFIRGLPYYIYDLKTLKTQQASALREFPFARLYPCLDDRYSKSGLAKGHYFHQDLLIARRVHYHNPGVHVDVGSRIDGLIAHLASFRSVDVIDIREIPCDIPNVRFIQADLMAPMRDDLVGCCDSLSSLHAIEHFGLGRYGDPISYNGYFLGLNNINQMLKKNGKFYFSVPIGRQRLEFNAHRIFSVGYLLELFAEKYKIDMFSFVDDQGDLHEDVRLRDVDVECDFDCMYGCGIFEMTKL